MRAYGMLDVVHREIISGVALRVRVAVPGISLSRWAVINPGLTFNSLHCCTAFN